MKKSELWLQVDKILWEDWDLIGVNDYGGLTMNIAIMSHQLLNFY